MCTKKTQNRVQKVIVLVKMLLWQIVANFSEFWRKAEKVIIYFEPKKHFLKKFQTHFLE